MKTEVTEIADKIYRLSTFLPKVGPNGFTFNQFLVDAERPLLFHYGQRALFPLVSDAVKSVIALDKLAWTTCSHVEADESGALKTVENGEKRRENGFCWVFDRDIRNAPRLSLNEGIIRP